MKGSPPQVPAGEGGEDQASIDVVRGLHVVGVVGDKLVGGRQVHLQVVQLALPPHLDLSQQQAK